MATAQAWIEGARLRTLPASAAPVLLGTGIAAGLGKMDPWLALGCLAVALLLQIGVNFSNDYSDGIRGTDEYRVGPPRLVGGGENPRKVLAVALSCFALASAVGLSVAIVSQSWWLIGAGVVAVAAAWFYTGGKHPYGYAGVGLSELLVFVFFGLVAVQGTLWVQAQVLPWQSWALASGLGLLSCALLMVNNLRDIPTDRKSGKVTLAVRLGDAWSRRIYQLFIYIALLLSLAVLFVPWSDIFPGGFIQWGSGFVVQLVLWLGALRTMRPVRAHQTGKSLIVALRNTGFLTLAYGGLLGLLFALL